MKSLSWSLVILFMLTVSVFGQQAKFGITVAGNSTNWRGSDAESFASTFEQGMTYIGASSDFTSEARLTFSLGAFYSIPLSPTIFFQPEINYVQRGSKLTGTMDLSIDDGYGGSSNYSLDADIVFKCDYIEIPFLLKFSTNSSRDRISFYAGPAYSILMSSKLMVKVSMEGESDSDTEDFSEFDENDFGFIGGAAIEMFSGVVIGARYYHGIKALASDSELYNKAITGYLGFIF
jgi:hypothetical protein